MSSPSEFRHHHYLLTQNFGFIDAEVQSKAKRTGLAARENSIGVV
jgi:hypothetical protein